jgi:hypothetical protein
MNIRTEKFPRPPDKGKTAAPAGTGHGGLEKHHTNNANCQPPKKQGACSECRWFDHKPYIADPALRAKLRHPHNRKGRWSTCQLSATRDPGARCRYFLNFRGGADG